MQWRKSDVLKETKKSVFSKKWVSKNMQKGMVPLLKIYFFISKTNLETLSFVLKLRSFFKKWNSYLLERSQVKTCFVWALAQANSKVSVQQSNLQSLLENLWKFQLKVITGTHPKWHFFLATLAKFQPALPQNGKSTTWKLYFTRRCYNQNPKATSKIFLLGCVPYRYASYAHVH